MKPSDKHPDLEAFLDKMASTFGETDSSRTEAIEENECVSCGHTFADPHDEFRDEASLEEYRISGLCQKCQDSVFD